MIGNIAHELISFQDHPHVGVPGSTGPVADGEREESNLYPSRKATLDYLHSYTEKHSLRQNISLSTEVVSVRVAGDNRWTVTTRNGLTGNEDTEIWDAVIYAGGLWERIYIPQIDGINLLPKENFVHARAYRSASMFAGKVCRLASCLSESNAVYSDSSFLETPTLLTTLLRTLWTSPSSQSTGLPDTSRSIASFRTPNVSTTCRRSQSSLSATKGK